MELPVKLTFTYHFEKADSAEGLYLEQLRKLAVMNKFNKLDFGEIHVIFCFVTHLLQVRALQRDGWR